ncbi:PTS transporter subunit EIIC [Cetobacterium somerae]|uniref:PTS transporter subunit EIIC n=1 Tax=Cetobacterium somerae TaxID=188913 RepID=UPI00224FF795|nr:PTS transporter subunit EIIC [Cetobacterium somerae]MCX3066324.1 PTS transporter subunit EIIC [Cetobacterium somerae]
MDNQSIAREIIEKLGSKDNIVVINNCMTRVRVSVKDNDKVDFENLDEIPGVIKVIKDDTIQVVVGPGKSKKIADEMKKLCGEISASNDEWKKTKESVKSKQSKFSSVLRRLANIFIPLIPAIIGAGLLNGIAGYFQNVYTAEGIKDMPMWITFFQTLGSGLFAYFAIFVGINSANEFGATPALGGVIGAITISGNINIFSKALGLYNAEVPLNSILIPGKGGIIGVIIGVAILAWVEKQLRKIIPDFLDTILTPMISLLIVGTLTIFAIMPFAGVVSDGIIKVFSFFIMSEGPMAIIGGFILAASFLPLLMVGLHHGLIPFYMVQLTQFGSISLFPILCMAGGGQIGGAAAIYIKAKNNKKLRDIIRSAMPVAILGIGEPMLYGVTLPLGKPFITASIAGGIGGAFLAATKVQTIAFGPAGITAIPLVVPGKILYYMIGLGISYIAGFIITYFFGIPKDIDEAI